jgi:anti-sigma regulatory factor (Ser/Thr protein kinase)
VGVSEPVRLKIPRTFSAIHPASETATSWLQARHVPDDALTLAALAIEELATNAIKYGGATAGGHIEVEIQVAAGRLTIVVSDDGHPFNPLDVPAPDTSLPIEEREVGGLGIHLLRTLSDEMSYERRDERNRVTIAKTVA